MLKLAKRVCDTCSKLSFADFELRFSQLDNFLNAINNGDENNIVIDSLLPADSITRFGKDLNHTVENEEINMSNRTDLCNVNTENAMPMICHGKVEVESTANDSVDSISKIKNESFHELLTFRRQRKIIGNVKGLNEKQRAVNLLKFRKDLKFLSLIEVESTSIVKHIFQ
uniref:Uncharacterized protein n=1 Tax=Romanomermis culicivorax TaxID=13658 RepID=A0A915I019_ROMCU